MSIRKFLKTRLIEDKCQAIPLLLSFTMLYAAYRKEKLKGKPDEIRDFIIKRNKLYFYLTLALAIFSLCFGTDLSIGESLIFVPIFLYALSRVNEIFIAFIRDASSHLIPHESTSSLKYHERIPLAFRSYAELIILFGIIYFGLNCWFDAITCNTQGSHCELSIWGSVYFSGVTITTLGFGEFTPNNFFSQFLTIYEVLAGFTLIVVSFTVYVSKSLNQ